MNAAPLQGLLVSVAVLCAAACGNDPIEPEVEDLTSARARWEATGIANYTYLYRLSCFCPPQLLETARVGVTDGEVTSVFLLDSDAPAAPDTYGLYETIDGLFDRLAGSLASDPVIFEATYDEAAGYPTSAQVDISEQIADEEYSFTASDLVAALP